MADKTKKYDDNSPGKWYVDQDCSACGVCTEDDPTHFKMAEDGSHAYCHKQPTADEEEACKTAMDGCPSCTIGNDA